MTLHRLLANRQFGWGFRIGGGGFNGGNKLYFPRRQNRSLTTLQLPKLGEDVASPPVFPIAHRTNAPQKQFGRRFLEHHASRAQLECAGHLESLNRRGQQDRGYRKLIVRQFPQNLQPRQSGHRQIKQKHVGLEFSRQGNGLLPIASLRHNREASLAGQQTPQAVPEDGVIIGDNDVYGVIHPPTPYSPLPLSGSSPP